MGYFLFLSMHFIQGNDRKQTQLFPISMEEAIDQDNEVRVIDLFVDGINLQDFDFTIKVSSEGRPAYHPRDLLKLFIYGYLNRIRSSRKLSTVSSPSARIRSPASMDDTSCS